LPGGSKLVERPAAVWPEALGHAEQRRARAGRRRFTGHDRIEAAGPERRQVGCGEIGMRGHARGLIGPAAKQRDLLAGKEGQRLARVGAGLGEEGAAGVERRDQPGAEASRPEQRHRQVEPRFRL
jgi:hypothetical protein